MEEKFLEYLKYEKNYSENTIINYQKELNSIEELKNAIGELGNN